MVKICDIETRYLFTHCLHILMESGKWGNPEIEEKNYAVMTGIRNTKYEILLLLTIKS